MLHLIKYQFRQTVREWSTMFWALAFPIILGTLFYVSFGKWDMEEDMEVIRTAVVEGADPNEASLLFFEEIDSDFDMIRTEVMKEEEALKALREDEIEGIFYAGEEPKLTVAKSGLEQSILKNILDTYLKNTELIQTIVDTHPEGLESGLEALADWQEMTEEISVGGRTLNPNISYFFALIAFAALSGVYLGIKGCCDSQANLSALGARRCITPTHKMKLIFVSFLVLFFIQFINIMILTVFVRFALGIDLGGSPGEIVLVNLLGSMIGVSIGILLGSVSRMQLGMKMGFGVLFTLFPAFLAGLMFGDMKNIIEQYCPVINRVNPAAMLSDSYYCMAVYNDAERMTRNLLILAVMSIVCVLAAFVVTRRERYDSI
ncbi:MAG: ABC transporter permease [Eubacteriales bacterium]|nr:ABC transporter permease [Eubacteriales bacterium]